MPDAAWKQFEREVAKRLGGTRRPVMGHEPGGTDIDHPTLAVQCKKRGKKYPVYLTDWIGGLVAACPDKIPIVVWGLKHRKVDDAAVIMKLSDFERLLGVVKGGKVAYTVEGTP